MRQHTQFHQESATDTKSTEMVIKRLYLLSRVRKHMFASANIVLFEDMAKQNSKKKHSFYCNTTIFLLHIMELFCSYKVQ